jgi:predicted DCC family thiol-disulfide oxidoreductase YuxK
MADAQPRAPQDFAPYSYRDDPAVPVFPDEKALIVFDGVCVMCSGFARFVAQHDKANLFRFWQAQSELGGALYRHYGLDDRAFETNLLVMNGVAYGRIDAFARIMRALGWPWSLARVLLFLPRSWSDRYYAAIARNRYAMFGKYETCPLPDDPSIAERMVG